jgi:hypothetical protein
MSKSENQNQYSRNFHDAMARIAKLPAEDRSAMDNRQAPPAPPSPPAKPPHRKAS